MNDYRRSSFQFSWVIKWLFLYEALVSFGHRFTALGQTDEDYDAESVQYDPSLLYHYIFLLFQFNGGMITEILKTALGGYDLEVVPGALQECPESPITAEIIEPASTYDHESRHYHFRARAYDPFMGRFLQTDPMGYADSMNLYQAFNMNPFNFTDPMGESLLPTLPTLFTIASECYDFLINFGSPPSQFAGNGTGMLANAVLTNISSFKNGLHTLFVDVPNAYFVELPNLPNKMKYEKKYSRERAEIRDMQNDLQEMKENEQNNKILMLPEEEYGPFPDGQRHYTNEKPVKIGPYEDNNSLQSRYIKKLEDLIARQKALLDRINFAERAIGRANDRIDAKNNSTFGQPDISKENSEIMKYTRRLSRDNEELKQLAATIAYMKKK